MVPAMRRANRKDLARLKLLMEQAADHMAAERIFSVPLFVLLRVSKCGGSIATVLGKPAWVIVGNDHSVFIASSNASARDAASGVSPCLK
jgi:hypothetical protein